MRDWRYLEGVSENPGAIVRRTWISKEKVEWYGELGMDFLDTPAYLLPNTPLTIRLTRSPPEFYMIQEDSEKAFRFVITDIHLDVKSVKVADALNEEIEQVLTTMPASYKWNQHYLKQFTLVKGAFKATIPNVFRDRKSVV